MCDCVVYPLRQMKSVAFRTVCAGGGAAHSLLRASHRGFPYRLFEILVDDTKAADVAASKRCMRDHFSTAFLKRLGGSQARLLSPESMAVLESIAASAWVSISHIEARNAKVRRLTESQDGAWALTLGQLAARFMLAVQRVSDQGPLPVEKVGA